MEPIATSTVTPATTATMSPGATVTAAATSTASAEPSPTLPPPAATATVPLPAAQTWRQLLPGGEVPSARRDHSLTANAEGSHVYLFGGRSDAGELADLWLYDVAQNGWALITATGDSPAARFGHNATLDPASKRLLIFGGQSSSTFFNDLWAFDPAATRWSQLTASASGPAPRYGAASAFDTSTARFFVSHGFTNQGRFDDTWVFDAASNTWTDTSPVDGERPESRCLVRMATDGNGQRLWLFGGQSNSAPFLDDFWSFDIAARSWQQLNVQRPSARNLYALTHAEGRMLLALYGGNSPDGIKEDVWVFDSGSYAWQPVLVEGGSPPPRHSHDMTWMRAAGVGLIFGGRGPDGDLNDLWELTLP
jgi:N-acetylneuraminic acid mutarotase